MTVTFTLRMASYHDNVMPLLLSQLNTLNAKWRRPPVRAEEPFAGGIMTQRRAHAQSSHILAAAVMKIILKA